MLRTLVAFVLPLIPFSPLLSFFGVRELIRCDCYGFDSYGVSDSENTKWLV